MRNLGTKKGIGKNKPWLFVIWFKKYSILQSRLIIFANIAKEGKITGKIPFVKNGKITAQLKLLRVLRNF